MTDEELKEASATDVADNEENTEGETAEERDVIIEASTTESQTEAPEGEETANEEAGTDEEREMLTSQLAETEAQLAASEKTEIGRAHV